MCRIWQLPWLLPPLPMSSFPVLPPLSPFPLPFTWLYTSLKVNARIFQSFPWSTQPLDSWSRLYHPVPSSPWPPCCWTSRACLFPRVLALAIPSASNVLSTDIPLGLLSQSLQSFARMTPPSYTKFGLFYPPVQLFPVCVTEKFDTLYNLHIFLFCVPQLEYSSKKAGRFFHLIHCWIPLNLEPCLTHNTWSIQI